MGGDGMTEYAGELGEPRAERDDGSVGATLHFRLPRHNEEFQEALKASTMRCVLAELDTLLCRYCRGKERPHVWHVERVDDDGSLRQAKPPEELSGDHLDAFEHVRGMIREMYEDRGLPLDWLI